MSEKAAKGLFFFLLTMVVFTFFSWKLDILRTPQALCVQPVQMELAGKDFYRAGRQYAPISSPSPRRPAAPPPESPGPVPA